MAEHTEATGATAGSTDVVDVVRRALSGGWTILRWLALLLVAVIWVAFWANLARLHLSRGNLGAVAVSAAPIVVPPVLLLLVLRNR